MDPGDEGFTEVHFEPSDKWTLQNKVKVRERQTGRLHLLSNPLYLCQLGFAATLNDVEFASIQLNKKLISYEFPEKN